MDELSQGHAVEIPLHVEGANKEDDFTTRFDPQARFGGITFPIARPKFLAIVSSTTLATMLARKANGRVDGFIVEGSSAGGHNAPPRGKTKFNERGEPIYTHRDMVDLATFRELGRPFWLAGSYGTPAHLAEALDAGANGIQVGTAFAFCEESGLNAEIKRYVIEAARDGNTDVLTDPLASPAGFPFKVLQYPASLSDTEVYEGRRRVCDLGYLRHAYRKEDGTVGWRCPAESPEQYTAKGGNPADLAGRKCLCNALLSNVDLGQLRHDGNHELPLLTCGDGVDEIVRFLRTPDTETYSARDVVDGLLAERPATNPDNPDSAGNLPEALPCEEPNSAIAG